MPGSNIPSNPRVSPQHARDRICEADLYEALVNVGEALRELYPGRYSTMHVAEIAADAASRITGGDVSVHDIAFTLDSAYDARFVIEAAESGRLVREWVEEFELDEVLLSELADLSTLPSAVQSLMHEQWEEAGRSDQWLDANLEPMIDAGKLEVRPGAELYIGYLDWRRSGNRIKGEAE